ncbi:keratin, type II cytoskeletal 8-like isoform X2 [Leucoraja erinacea]|uniref:keratin, type II cytoskeletal 8-like isoform X2 n=1 Tax=Leucoraja erinaceus TaxID=7782 RepID=UPI00245426BD|nr:keratin, type II cytoskeletal 8-like isoform X2 [Leucoraja erinacea]
MAGRNLYHTKRFSSQSYTPGSAMQRASSVRSAGYLTSAAAPRVNIKPLSLEVPHFEDGQAFQELRNQEKEQIKGLNNQFACFIDKVRSLEQRNKQLETHWHLLQERGSRTSNIDTLYQAYANNLKLQIDGLAQEKLRLGVELDNVQGLVEDYKTKYEDEINMRTEKENEFVMIKKDVDESYLNKVELEAKLESLIDEINFLKEIFDEEIRELQVQIKSTAVTLEVDTSRNLDLSHIIDDVRAQYEGMVNKMRQDNMYTCETKFTDMKKNSGKCADDLRIVKTEITDMQRQNGRLNSEIQALKQQREQLETAISEAEERGGMAIADAKARIAELQNAIDKGNQEMLRQVREYQELMNTKLALDIEIATYKKLLEGEESRLSKPVNVTYHQSVKSHSYPAMQFETSLRGGLEQSLANKSLIVKTIETRDGKTLSESSVFQRR